MHDIFMREREGKREGEERGGENVKVICLLFLRKVDQCWKSEAHM